METSTIEIDLTEESVDILAEAVYYKVRTILDDTSLQIVEEAMENGDFEVIKLAIGDALFNSVILEALKRAIEFDETERNR